MGYQRKIVGDILIEISVELSKSSIDSIDISISNLILRGRSL